jgi:RNA polymerase sigma-32 factor
MAERKKPQNLATQTKIKNSDKKLSAKFLAKSSPKDLPKSSSMKTLPQKALPQKALPQKVWSKKSVPKKLQVKNSLATASSTELITPTKKMSKTRVSSSQLVHPEILDPRSPEERELSSLDDVEQNLNDVVKIIDPSDAEDILVEALKLPKKLSSSDKALTSIDPISTYLAELKNYPLLTKEGEYALAIRYREHHDSKAAEQLVTSNLRFVVKVAAEYSKFGAKLIDLIQEGNVGLMHAVKEFNPYKGVRLITYAVWWIRGYIQEYLMRQYSMVRIGTTANQRKLFYRLQKEKERLDAMGKEPSFALLSSRLGVTEQEVLDMSSRMSGRDVSLNQPVGEDGKASLLEFEPMDEVGADEQIGKAEELEILHRNIEAIRSKLNAKELYILEHRLLADEPMTLQEIGDHYGTTREAVRQLETRLMNKIKNAFVESSLGSQNKKA